MAEPVAEVVPAPQVGSLRTIRRPAEVGRLVPAVPGGGQRLDDALEVRLHRLGLALQLGAVGVREACARLGFQLVRRDVLGLERQRLGEVVVEVGGFLARDAVDEIQGDVVDPCRAEAIDGAANVVRPGDTVEHGEKPRREGLGAEGDTVDARTNEQRGELGRHRLGIRLDRHLGGLGQRTEEPLELRRLDERGRSAAEIHSVEGAVEELRTEIELAQHRVHVALVVAVPADDRDEVAVPAA